MGCSQRSAKYSGHELEEVSSPTSEVATFGLSGLMLTGLILRWIEGQPGLTPMEIGDRLGAAVGYRPLTSIVRRFFQRHGVTQKKRRRVPPNKSAPI